MKKASLNISLMEVIGLIVGSLVIITLIFFVLGISDLFKNDPEQAMYDNYDALVISVQELVKGNEGDSLSKNPDKRIEIVPSEENKVQIVIPLYLQDGYGIVGFDTDKIGQVCKTRNPSLTRPESCNDRPCLCLGKLDNFFSVKGDIRCSIIGDVENIYSRYQEGKVPAETFNYGKRRDTGLGSSLVLWSNCEPDPSFWVKNVKIIKLPGKEAGKFDLMFDVLPS